MFQTYLDPVRFPREQELSDAETECKGKLKQHHRLPWCTEERVQVMFEGVLHNPASCSEVS